MSLESDAAAFPANGYRVTELNAGGVLDHTLYLVRDHWRLIVYPWLVFCVPLNLATVLAVYIFSAVDWIDIDRGIPPLFTGEINFVTMGHGLLNFFISGPLLAGAVTYGLGMAYMGTAPTVSACLGVAFRRWITLVVVYMIVGVLAGVGALLCLIPGILAQLLLLVAPPVAVLEQTDPFTALTRSARLMRNHLLAAFVLLLVVNLIAGPVTSLLMLIPHFETSVFLMLMFSTLYPVLNLVMCVVFYASARCHSESLDLDLMANAVDAPADAQAAAL